MGGALQRAPAKKSTNSEYEISSRHSLVTQKSIPESVYQVSEEERRLEAAALIQRWWRGLSAERVSRFQSARRESRRLSLRTRRPGALGSSQNLGGASGRYRNQPSTGLRPKQEAAAEE